MFASNANTRNSWSVSGRRQLARHLAQTNDRDQPAGTNFYTLLKATPSTTASRQRIYALATSRYRWNESLSYGHGATHAYKLYNFWQRWRWSENEMVTLDDHRLRMQICACVCARFKETGDNLVAGTVKRPIAIWVGGRFLGRRPCLCSISPVTGLWHTPDGDCLFRLPCRRRIEQH